jgi:NAD+ synthase (glutamine-hydrolysing)
MKIALAQINIHVGNFEFNIQKITKRIDEAKAKGAELVVFPELAVCGYPARDFLTYREFVQRCEDGINAIAKHCVDIYCIIGSPSFNESEKGKTLRNSAFVLHAGRVESVVHKALLPTYDIFDEYRYFEPNSEFHCIQIGDKKVALTICEDLWNTDQQQLYPIRPMDELIKQQPDVMINIAASPFDYLQANKRKEVLRWNAEKYQLPLLYVNHVGAQTELIFDGGSCFMQPGVSEVASCNYFEEELLFCDIASKDEVKSQIKELNEMESIYKALVMGIRDYFQKSGFKKAILGLSGGIDSAVVACLAADALGPNEVLAVLMPSKYSSDHSITDALSLVNNLGIVSEIIPIEPMVSVYEEQLREAFKSKAADLTEENMQARIRAVILMALSNKHGHILLNTSNKSEAAVGYGTLYGDMCGGISVIGDVYKTKVFELAKFINRDKEIIPINTITKPPSAELRPDQKDSDSLPEYDVLDKILFQYIELSQSKENIMALKFDAKLVEKVVGLVNRNEYKRYQTPPILRVSPKAFGMGRRMPIVAKY